MSDTTNPVAPTARPDYIWCIEVDANPPFLWCGRKRRPFERCFAGTDHAAMAVRKGDRLVPCPECAKAISSLLLGVKPTMRLDQEAIEYVVWQESLRQGVTGRGATYAEAEEDRKRQVIERAKNDPMAAYWMQRGYPTYPQDL